MTVAFVIFGWPKRTKEYGPAYPAVCPNCNNETHLSLVKLRRWLSLYFIPVLPLGRATYYLACEVCAAAVELETKTQVKLAKDLVEPTERFVDGEMSEREYEREVAPLEAELSVEEVDVLDDPEEHGRGHRPATTGAEPSASGVSGAELLLHTDVEELSDEQLEATMAILASFGQGPIVEEQQLVDRCYPDNDLGYDTSDGWWRDFARPLLEDHPKIERVDETGSRWRLAEE